MAPRQERLAVAARRSGATLTALVQRFVDTLPRALEHPAARLPMWGIFCRERC